VPPGYRGRDQARLPCETDHIITMKIDSGMSMDYYMPKKGDAPDLLTTDEMFKTETLILQDLAAASASPPAASLPASR